MKKYYTRACNFYYGKKSKNLIENKKTLPLNGNPEISFDHVEIFSRTKSKIVHIKEIKYLSKKTKVKVNKDLKNIVKIKKIFLILILKIYQT